jgi:hypothetical protein
LIVAVGGALEKSQSGSVALAIPVRGDAPTRRPDFSSPGLFGGRWLVLIALGPDVPVLDAKARDAPCRERQMEPDSRP